MVWLLIDAENYFKDKQESYGIKKGNKGIQEHTNNIHNNELLLIYDVSRKQIEQIYMVTDDGVYETDRDEYPLGIGVSYVDRLDTPISFEEMKRLLPNSEFVKDHHRRAIGSITPNEWRILREYLLENNHRFLNLLRLFAIH